jgi:hypothetical protein
MKLPTPEEVEKISAAIERVTADSLLKLIKEKLNAGITFFSCKSIITTGNAWVKQATLKKIITPELNKNGWSMEWEPVCGDSVPNIRLFKYEPPVPKKPNWLSKFFNVKNKVYPETNG